MEIGIISMANPDSFQRLDLMIREVMSHIESEDMLVVNKDYLNEH